MRSWPEVKTDALAILRIAKNKTEACDRCSELLGKRVTWTAIEHAYKRWRSADPGLPTLQVTLSADLTEQKRTEEDHAPDPKDRRLAQQAGTIIQLRKHQVALYKQLDEADERFQVALAIQEEQTPINIKAKSAKKHEATAVFLASDWHVEERVDADTINGRNEYNPTIARRRANNYFDAVAWLIKYHRKGGYDVRKAVLAIIGDLITGYIHEELQEGNYMSPIEASLFAQELLGAGIQYILADTDVEQLDIPCGHGNHGRTTKKTRVSTGAKNSHEWMIYHNLKQRFANDSRIQFHIPTGIHEYATIYDTVIRFTHGDTIKYNGGVGGVTIPLNKAIDKWNDFMPADITCMGHWHQYFDAGHFVINGSLIGYNAFALSIKAAYEKPQQASFLIDSRHGKTMSCPIWVE